MGVARRSQKMQQGKVSVSTGAQACQEHLGAPVVTTSTDVLGADCSKSECPMLKKAE